MNIKSVELMKKFVDQGRYRNLKLAEEKKRNIIGDIKERLINSEFRRQEFPMHGLVAKFTMDRDYEWDYKGLNEYLADVGLLIPVATMLSDKHLKLQDIYEKVIDYKYPTQSYSLRPYFNKSGKAVNNYKEESLTHYKSKSLNTLLSDFKIIKNEVKITSEEYGLLKREIISCPVLRKNKRIKYDYGSLALIPEKSKFNILAIAKTLGRDFLINFSKPDMNKLGKFVLKGTISEKEIYQFRKDITDTDKEMKFTVMNIEDEIKQLQMLSKTSLMASLARDKRKKA